jgi:hypothetical protein
MRTQYWGKDSQENLLEGNPTFIDNTGFELADIIKN